MITALALITLAVEKTCTPGQPCELSFTVSARIESENKFEETRTDLGDGATLIAYRYVEDGAELDAGTLVAIGDVKLRCFDGVRFELAEGAIAYRVDSSEQLVAWLDRRERQRLILAEQRKRRTFARLTRPRWRR